MTIDTSKWKKVSFGDVAKCLTEATRDPVSEGLDRFIGLEHIEPESLHIRSWGNVSQGTTFTRVFRKGQVLFGKRRAYQKKAALAEFDGVCSGDILVCEAINDAILPELLPFVVQSDRFFEHAIRTSAGSLSPRTKFKDLANFTFKLPAKLEEQKHIANLLWAIDAVEQRYASSLEKTTILKRAYFQELFSGAFRRVKKIKLGEVCSIRRGASPRPIDDPKWFSDKGPGWIRIADVTKSYKFLNETTQYLSKNGVEKSVFLPKGSLIMSICATIGKPIIVNIDACIHDGFVTFKYDESVISTEYLFYLLSSLEQYFVSKKQIGTQGNLNTQIVGSTQIPLLSRDEQDRVVGDLCGIDACLENQKSCMLGLSAMRKGLTHKIFNSNV